MRAAERDARALLDDYVTRRRQVTAMIASEKVRLAAPQDKRTRA